MAIWRTTIPSISRLRNGLTENENRTLAASGGKSTYRENHFANQAAPTGPRRCSDRTTFSYPCPGWGRHPRRVHCRRVSQMGRHAEERWRQQSGEALRSRRRNVDGAISRLAWAWATRRSRCSTFTKLKDRKSFPRIELCGIGSNQSMTLKPCARRLSQYFTIRLSRGTPVAALSSRPYARTMGRPR